METRITSTELAKSLSDVLNRAKYRGERFIVERGGEIVARIEPCGPREGVTMREIAQRLRGWKMPGGGFADDLEAAQRDQAVEPPPAWPN